VNEAGTAISEPDDWRSLWPELALVLLSIPIILIGLGSYSLVNGDEGLYHDVAATMARSGDWTRVVFTGEPRVYDTFVSAPLQSWARAALILAFGDNLWTMRVLSAVFAVLTVVATCRLARRQAGPWAGFAAGAILLTTVQFVYLHGARTGELEPLVTCLITLAALLFVRSIEEERGFVGHHLCLAALVNIKLPVVAVPLLAQALCFALDRRARRRLGAYVVTGLALLPLALAWHGFQAARLWDELPRVLAAMGGHAAGGLGTVESETLDFRLRYYGRTLLFGAFPYVLAYPLAAIGLLWRPRSESARFGWRVIALYAAVAFAFFVAIVKNNPW